VVNTYSATGFWTACHARGASTTTSGNTTVRSLLSVLSGVMRELVFWRSRFKVRDRAAGRGWLRGAAEEGGIRGYQIGQHSIQKPSSIMACSKTS
jgi:hypothetical protein